MWAVSAKKVPKVICRFFCNSFPLKAARSHALPTMAQDLGTLSCDGAQIILFRSSSSWNPENMT